REGISPNEVHRHGRHARALLASMTVSTGAAGFWRRFGAALIDAILAALLVAIVFAVIEQVMPGLHQQLSEPTRYNDGTSGIKLTGLGAFLIGVILLLYKAVPESRASGATLGKRLLRIRVTGVEGKHLPFLRAVIRAWPTWAMWIAQGLIQGSTWVVGPLALFACLSVALRKSKRGWHDSMARASVVHRA